MDSVLGTTTGQLLAWTNTLPNLKQTSEKEAHIGDIANTRLTSLFSFTTTWDNQQIETQRRLHEEIDRLEQAVVDQFMLNPKTVRFYSLVLLQANFLYQNERRLMRKCELKHFCVLFDSKISTRNICCRNIQ